MANEYLKRTPTSTGNRRVFTWSGWVKKNEINTGFGRLFEVGADTNNRSYFTFREVMNQNLFTEMLEVLQINSYQIMSLKILVLLLIL